MRRAGSRSLPAALAAALLLAAAAAAQPDADVEAAGRVVMQQLDAFRRGDFEAAFTFASASIHDQFDRSRFEQMVRGGYPEIARSISAVIDGSKRGDGGQLYLFLSIRGDNGNVVEAVYELVNEQGAWRVNGVVTRPDTSERA
jgi:uncharacterized protein DUF4864